MSYDLHLFTPPPGRDLAEAGADSFENEGDGPPTAARAARIREIADALLAHEPRLRLLPLGPRAGEPADPALPELAHGAEMQLPVADDEEPDGISIWLYARTVAVSFPYWHDGAARDAVWARVGGYCRALEDAFGFRTFDPQRDAVVDWEANARAAADAYARGREVVARIQARADRSSPAPRPWWRFWR